MFRLCAAVLGVCVLASCSSPKPPASTQAAATTPALWGEMKPVVSVKELMRYVIDPASDNIFDAVKTVTTKKGTVDTLPKTEEDWEKLRIGAVTIAESVYLLKVPRPFAPPGDENNSTGPDATELSPAQIKKKLEGDPVLWNAKIEALRNVGLEVLEIVKTKKTADLWEASYNLDQACESCHIQYWYPGDKALLERVDRKLFELYGEEVILLLAAAAFIGHHSLAADFDTTKHITLTGRVTKIEWMNPHVHIYLDVNKEHWSVEMGSPNGLSQRGWTPKSMTVGDVIIVDGSRAKDGSHIANARSIVLPSGVRLSAAPPEGKTS